MGVQMHRPDVIILGAGAAGLMAARRLTCHGYWVLVLEARDRLGGRILTLDKTAAAPLPQELGAEFIHGRPRVALDLIREAGLVTCEVPFEHAIMRGGTLVSMENYDAQLARVFGGMARLRRDTTFAEYIHRRVRRGSPPPPSAVRLATDFIEGFDAADPKQVSAKAIAHEQEGLGDVENQKQYRLLEGYGALVNHLRASADRRRLTILTSTPATQIQWSRGRVAVLAGNPSRRASLERFSAKALLTTLPLGTLCLQDGETGAVEFTPALPQVRRAMTHLRSGAVIKCLLTFREPFWEDLPRAARQRELLQGASFFHDPASPFPTFWTSRPLGSPTMTAWAGGPPALTLSNLAEREIINAALASLARLIGTRTRKVKGLLAHAATHNWVTDPYARGAYSYEALGGSRARRVLATPIEGTLYFAGEAADTSGQASTVAGALASGNRAADQIIRTFERRGA